MELTAVPLLITTAFQRTQALWILLGGIICVTLLNRLLGDQVQLKHDDLKAVENRPVEVFERYVRHCINNNNILSMEKS